MAETTIGNLTLGAVDGTTLFEQERTVSGSQVSEKVTSSNVANFVGTSAQFAGLSTTAKNLVGAINEAAQSGGGASVIQLTAAEYTALSTAEKMNGSIYKLTDKAIFYCLDEEYHPVKELTTAQYEALTTAEQNNGTIYIQTDAETTASDIPYSQGVSVADKLDNVPTFYTLTTSDNNKLLGVSVSGSDVSVGAVDLNTIIDINENFTSSSTMAYTGVSFEVPANKNAIVTVTAIYAATRPNIVTVNSSSTNINAQLISGTYINKGTQASGVLVNNTNASKTYYVWAEYASAGSNIIEVHGIII